MRRALLSDVDKIELRNHFPFHFNCLASCVAQIHRARARGILIINNVACLISMVGMWLCCCCRILCITRIAAHKYFHQGHESRPAKYPFINDVAYTFSELDHRIKWGSVPVAFKLFHAHLLLANHSLTISEHVVTSSPTCAFFVRSLWLMLTTPHSSGTPQRRPLKIHLSLVLWIWTVWAAAVSSPVIELVLSHCT